MSMTYMVTKGKIPLTTLKEDLKAGKLKHGKLLIGGTNIKDKRSFGIKYSKEGVWWAEPSKNGGTEFTEYAGGHGDLNSMMELIEELQKKYKVEIWDEMAVAEGIADSPKPTMSKRKVRTFKKNIININKDIPSAFSSMTKKTTEGKAELSTKELLSAASSGIYWKGK